VLAATGRLAGAEPVGAAHLVGHNYIGTEHLLLGVLAADGRAGQALTTARLDRETAEQLLASEFAELQARHTAGAAS
jgi:Clp amino terminal domain, pathogenicity island component